MHICVRYKWTNKRDVQDYKRHIWKRKNVGASSVVVFIDDHSKKSKLSVVLAGLHFMKQIHYVQINNSVIMEDW